MRLPFDLIAVLLALEAIRAHIADQFSPEASSSDVIEWSRQEDSLPAALGGLAAFWLVVWLAHEALTRRTEFRTRWGRAPRGVAGRDGTLPKRHPMAWHATGESLVRALSVGLFILFLWHYRWPARTSAWPEWLGLDGWSEGVREGLRRSLCAGGILDLGPFVVAVVLGWIPRRRLAQEISNRAIALKPWLVLEAQLTFLPLMLWLACLVLVDGLEALALLQPGLSNLGLQKPWVQILLGLGALFLFIGVLAPWFTVRFWGCRPFPESELRDRLTALLKRSGVRARAILAWGPRGAGMINACVLGPWAPLRYVLVSPGLVEHLTLEECEAVLAHELGHARHGHLKLLAVVGIGVGAFSALALKISDFKNPWAQAAVCLAAVVVFVCVLFGAVLRACERDADLASADLMGSPQPLARALEKVATLAGGIRDVYSWHHGTIGARVEHLLREGLDPERRARYHRRVRQARIAFTFLALLLAAALIGMELAHP